MPKKFPFYKQHDAMDCGAACLRMVAKSYDRFYSLEYLKDLMFVDREGVSLLGISDAAEEIGMHTISFKIPYTALLNAPKPFIAHWKQNHFVVVYKMDEKSVWIADPASGKIKYKKAEFMEGWANDVQNDTPVGVILLLEPTPDFYDREDETQKSKSDFKYLLSYVFKYKRLVIQLILGLIFGSVIQLAFPFLMQIIVDNGIINQNLNFIFLVLMAQLVLFLSQQMIEFIRGWILLHIGTRVNISLISEFLAKLMKLPIRYFDTKMTGDLLQRIFDNKRIEEFLTSASLITLFSFFNFIIFGIVLLSFNTEIFLIFSTGTAAYLLWVYFFLKKRKELDYKRFDQLSANQNALIQLINGMQEIKLHNAEKQKRWEWEAIQSKLFRVSKNYLGLDQWQRAGANFINESKNIIITFVAAKAVIDGSMTLGMMLAVQYMIGQLNGPIESIVRFMRAAQDAKISLERMNEIHVRDNEEDIKNKLRVLPDEKDLFIENLYFKYGGPHTPMVLKDINIHIPEGRTTAIVGKSGCGKTTILKLLLNFYKPNQGAVKLGDTNLTTIQNRLWRQKCGVVMQDGFIFSDTIANNIALGDKYVDKKKLLNAVKVANIQTFIESQPLAYNTKIGSDGIGISSGQKQRILIARAVYKNPEYIFFDEATNSLDAYNEMTIMDRLDEFFAGKTVVIVAHRLNTVRNADNIIVMDRGEVIEQGNHDELVNMHGAYFHLVKNQLELGA